MVIRKNIGDMMAIKYIREDDENTKNLLVGYQLWPFEDDDDEIAGYISSMMFYNYNDAADYAMSFLKNPEIILEENFIKEKSDDLIERVSEISGLYITESLNIMDMEGDCIDCPTDYIIEVGRVYKEISGEETKIS